MNKLKKCCFKNIDKAIRVGRAHYICPKCKGDVSLMAFFYWEAILKDKTKDLPHNKTI